MATLFLFAAAVQYNDPDPLRWMAIHGLVVLTCVLSLARHLPRLVPVLVGLGAVAWAGTLAPGVIGPVKYVSEIQRRYESYSNLIALK